MIRDAIDFRYLLIDKYKELKITEEEVVVILMVDYLLSQNNKLLTAESLSFKMNIEEKKIDKILASLLSRNLISYETENNETVTSLKPLKDKLYLNFEKALEKENEQNNSKEIKELLKKIYVSFETTFGRELMPVEKNKLKELFAFGYTVDQINNAFKDCVNNNKKSLKDVEQVLITYEIRDDLENEGHTTIRKDWNKNLEETIKIAKTPWLDDDK